MSEVAPANAADAVPASEEQLPHAEFTGEGQVTAPDPTVTPSSDSPEAGSATGTTEASSTESSTSATDPSSTEPSDPTSSTPEESKAPEWLDTSRRRAEDEGKSAVQLDRGSGVDDPTAMMIARQAGDMSPEELRAYQQRWSKHLMNRPELPDHHLLSRVAYEVHAALTQDAQPFDELPPEAQNGVLAHLENALRRFNLL